VHKGDDDDDDDNDDNNNNNPVFPFFLFCTNFLLTAGSHSGSHLPIQHFYY